jgi:pimeloyl-ACP methyl ester carboxylesterase
MRARTAESIAAANATIRHALQRIARRRALPAALVCVLAAFCAGADTDATDANALHRTRIEGNGPPTVIFEGGLGDTLDVWSDVQSSIAEHCARTLAYNRAGYPGSPPADGTRDAATIVEELRAELHARDIPPPYVLVGHSLGGLYMQYFARSHPDEVTGLLLLDSTHWDQRLPNGPQATAAYAGRRAVIVFMPWIARRELTASGSAGVQVHESPAAGQVPTVVLSSTRAPLGETPAGRTEAARLQEGIAADFPAARQIRVESSGHYIQHDRPDIVIDAARELAGCSVRNGEPRTDEGTD